MIVLLDQDGVLADFERGLLAAWNRAYPDIPGIQYEERRNFRVRDDYPASLRTNVSRLYESPGFFLNLQPIEGALDSVAEMLSAGIDVRICTSAIDEYENCVLEKYQWVERHLGGEFTQRIVLTKDKTLVTGDWLVDDKPVINGIRSPSWKHVIFDAPYNRHVTALPRMKWSSWRSAIAPRHMN
jgi:5'-nucleotidase